MTDASDPRSSDLCQLAAPAAWMGTRALTAALQPSDELSSLSPTSTARSANALEGPRNLDRGRATRSECTSRDNLCLRLTPTPQGGSLPSRLRCIEDGQVPAGTRPHGLPFDASKALSGVVLRTNLLDLRVRQARADATLGRAGPPLLWEGNAVASPSRSYTAAELQLPPLAPSRTFVRPLDTG